MLTIRQFSLIAGQLLFELIDHKEVIRDLKFAPDGSMNLGKYTHEEYSLALCLDHIKRLRQA